LRLSDFDYALDESSIARHPAERRDGSRLLVVDRSSGALTHTTFARVGEHLAAGDLLVANNSRVIRARLSATKVGTGGRVEVFLVEPTQDDRTWRALLRPAKKVRVGAELAIGDDVAVVEALEGDGFGVLRLPRAGAAVAADHGALPLPPYIDRPAGPEDEERYQTIFAREGLERSVAAPTAGLHFTDGLVEQLASQGVGLEKVTLHVGPGTFLPVRTDDVTDHKMHSEAFELSDAAAARIEAAKRVVSVGTTSTRVLETVGRPVRAAEGRTELFIRPGFAFAVVGAMITNFHLPKSTLLMLVCAFGGRDLILGAYEEARDAGYRFYSYGDAMLIL
jgi:S-adenosylmethionine:tRNA ribosyltransferase-isomerase